MCVYYCSSYYQLGALSRPSLTRDSFPFVCWNLIFKLACLYQCASSRPSSLLPCCPLPGTTSPASVSRLLLHCRAVVPYPVPSLQPRRRPRAERTPPARSSCLPLAGQRPWNHSGITRGRPGAAAARGSGGAAVAPVLLQRALRGRMISANRTRTEYPDHHGILQKLT